MNLIEKTYARKLLESRRVRVSVGRVLRANVRRYLILLVALAVVVGCAWSEPSAWMTNGAFFFGGCVLATFLRDWGWARVSQRSWPFSEKVIDWRLVEEMAAEEERGARA